MSCNKECSEILDNTSGGWTAKLQLVSSFEVEIKQRYVNFREGRSPLENFSEQAALAMIAAMHLILRRPPYLQHPHFVPPSDDFDVLGQATEALQHELEIKSVEFAPWRWKSWVQWYALAVVLAELCSEPAGTRFDTAYTVAEQMFSQYASLIADSETGKLWKPIAKLMRRVRHIKLSHSTPPDSSRSTASAQTTFLPRPSQSSSFTCTNESPDLSMSMSWALNSGAIHDGDKNTYLAGAEQITEMDENSCLDWFTFMNEVNANYSLSAGDDSFWVAGLHYTQQDDLDKL
jgi:hypothetical protein